MSPMATTADRAGRETQSSKQMGRHLRQVRKQQGLSRADVARSAGLTRRELAAYERGRVDVPESDLWCLAGSCGVDVGELLPERQPLTPMSGLSALPVGDSILHLRGPGEPDGFLREYLAMIYELRNLPPGSRVPLREPDLAQLAEALGGSSELIEQRLVDLIGASHDEAARLRAMILPPLSLASGNGASVSDLYAGLQEPAADPSTGPGHDFFAAPPPEDPFGTPAAAAGAPAPPPDPSASIPAGLAPPPPDPLARIDLAPPPPDLPPPITDPFAVPAPDVPAASLDGTALDGPFAPGAPAPTNGNGHHDGDSIVVDDPGALGADPFAPIELPEVTTDEPPEAAPSAGGAFYSDTPMLAEVDTFDAPLVDAPLIDAPLIDAPIVDVEWEPVETASSATAPVAPLPDGAAEVEEVAPIAWSADGERPAAPEATAVASRLEQVGANWRVGGISPGTAMADDGALALRRADARWALADVDAPGDFTIEATVDFTSGAGFGVLFRASVDDAERISGYSFDMDPVAGGGGYLLRQWEDNRQHWRPLEQTLVTDPGRLYGRHTMQLTLRGDHLTVIVDDEVVLSVPALSRASVGLGRGPCKGSAIGIQAWATTEVNIDAFRVAQG